MQTFVKHVEMNVRSMIMTIVKNAQMHASNVQMHAEIMPHDQITDFADTLVSGHCSFIPMFIVASQDSGHFAFGILQTGTYYKVPVFFI
ncbi:hypothetical protein ACJROX_16885 [Pseudalkalibacillus sp. A8]|uniref:hypothetical protein n=1 Tax=Pseudalkalibacillus sp. A8 TaxID=3382641 RepID=UPI0038B583A7